MDPRQFLELNCAIVGLEDHHDFYTVELSLSSALDASYIPEPLHATFENTLDLVDLTESEKNGSDKFLRIPISLDWVARHWFGLDSYLSSSLVYDCSYFIHSSYCKVQSGVLQNKYSECFHLKIRDFTIAAPSAAQKQWFHRVWTNAVKARCELVRSHWFRIGDNKNLTVDDFERHFGPRDEKRFVVAGLYEEALLLKVYLQIKRHFPFLSLSSKISDLLDIMVPTLF